MPLSASAQSTPNSALRTELAGEGARRSRGRVRAEAEGDGVRDGVRDGVHDGVERRPVTLVTESMTESIMAWASSGEIPRLICCSGQS